MIPADLVARKVQELERTEGSDARQVREILWFIQWASWQEGGLVALARDIAAKTGDHFGTPRMLARREASCYTVAECIAIWREIPCGFRPDEIDSRHWRLLCQDEEYIDLDGDGACLRAGDLDPDGLIRDLSPVVCARICAEAFEVEMPRRLEELCTVPGQDFSGWSGTEGCRIHTNRDWMLDSLRNTLCQYMEMRARDIAQRVALTEVTKQVWDGMDYAIETRSLVHIDGDPRIGKTESVETRCLMYPGRFRLVKTPCSNSDADFFKAIAIALGIDPLSSKFRDRVEGVCDCGGPALTFDESHFLYPARYSEATPPMRLNWIRTRIVDTGQPCLLISSPQSWRQVQSRFLSKTRYTMEQFTGRIGLTVKLPSELSMADLIAVGRIHFRDLGEDYLELLAAKAMQSEGYLMAVQNIAKRAGWLAQRAGKRTVTLELFDQAVREIFPAVKTVPEPLVPVGVKRPHRKRAATRPQPPRSRIAGTLRRPALARAEAPAPAPNGLVPMAV